MESSSNSKLISKEKKRSFIIELVWLKNEKDERYRYLLTYGEIYKSFDNGGILLVELPQLTGKVIFYRKPSVRDESIYDLNCQFYELKAVPLFEGEERLKHLNLQNNYIQSIENLVSLPNLESLDLSRNKITQIINLAVVGQLTKLDISRNNLVSIKGIEVLKQLEELNISENKIAKLDPIENLVKVRTLDASNNEIKKMKVLSSLVNMTNLDISNNKVDKLEGIFFMKRLTRLEMRNNEIEDFENFQRLKQLLYLKELDISGNPVCRNNEKTLVQNIETFAPHLSKFNQKDIKTLKSPLINTTKELKDSTSPLSNEELKKLMELPPRPQSHSRASRGKTIDEKNSKKNLEGKPSYFSNKLKPGPKKSEHDKSYRSNAENQSFDKSRDIVSVIEEEFREGNVESGHAEVEGNVSLFIYGNALNAVLCRSDLYDKINKVY